LQGNRSKAGERTPWRAVATIGGYGVLRLREWSAARSIHFAQDDRRL